MTTCLWVGCNVLPFENEIDCFIHVLSDHRVSRNRYFANLIAESFASGSRLHIKRPATTTLGASRICQTMSFAISAVAFYLTLVQSAINPLETKVR